MIGTDTRLAPRFGASGVKVFAPGIEYWGHRGETDIHSVFASKSLDVVGGWLLLVAIIR